MRLWTLWARGQETKGLNMSMDSYLLLYLALWWTGEPSRMFIVYVHDCCDWLLSPPPPPVFFLSWMNEQMFYPSADAHSYETSIIIKNTPIKQINPEHERMLAVQYNFPADWVQNSWDHGILKCFWEFRVSAETISYTCSTSVHLDSNWAHHTLLLIFTQIESKLMWK